MKITDLMPGDILKVNQSYCEPHLFKNDIIYIEEIEEELDDFVICYTKLNDNTYGEIICSTYENVEGTFDIVKLATKC